MKLKHLLLAMALLILTVGLAACGDDNNAGSSNTDDNGSDGSSEDGDVTLEVAALKSAYGEEGWKNVIDQYEEAHDNVTVDLTIEKNLEEVVRPNMQAGDYPDVFLLATDREEALTETMIKEQNIEKITDIKNMKVSGEDQTVDDKVLDGFMDTLATNPYADGEMYMAPMFYSPSGLFYNKGLFEEKGWDVPETWEDMFELGDKAKEDGKSLFTYSIAGYFDTLIRSMLYSAGGADLFDSAMEYEDGVWESDEATKVFETVGKLKDYVHPDTIANANPNDFTKNQQLVLDNEALFMPSGTWVVDEMAEAPRADNFEWGLMPVPAFEEGGDRYAFTFFEQIWIPKEADNKDTAKDFITYMYSDDASDAFLETGAVQPVNGIVDKLEGQKQTFYNIYEEQGALPAMGTFASTDPVPGVSMSESLYEKIDSVMSGDTSVEQWQKEVEETSDELRPALK